MTRQNKSDWKCTLCHQGHSGIRVVFVADQGETLEGICRRVGTLMMFSAHGLYNSPHISKK